jgi:hypothetical protein
MPTLGWWKAGVRVPAPPALSSSFPSSSPTAGNTVPNAAQLSEGLCEAAAAAAPATQWLSSMNHEADGARNYDLTNYNILLESTWGGDQAAGERLRAMLKLSQPLPPPPLLPASPPLPPTLVYNQIPTGVDAQQGAGAGAAQTRAPSRASLKDRTSAGLFKVGVTLVIHYTSHVTSPVTYACDNQGAFRCRFWAIAQPPPLLRYTPSGTQQDSV